MQWWCCYNGPFVSHWPFLKIVTWGHRTTFSMFLPKDVHLQNFQRSAKNISCHHKLSLSSYFLKVFAIVCVVPFHCICVNTVKRSWGQRLQFDLNVILRWRHSAFLTHLPHQRMHHSVADSCGRQFKSTCAFVRKFKSCSQGSVTAYMSR